MPARTPFSVLLEARSAMALDLSADGAEVLVASNLSGTMQLYRLPTGGGRLLQVTDLAEPVSAARYLPGSDDIVLATDAGGDERLQLRLVRRDGSALRDLVVDPERIHRLGAASRDGARIAYVTNRRTGVDFDVVVRELVDGAERVLLEGGHNHAHGFSADGRHLIVERAGELPMDSSLWLLDVAGSAPPLEVTPHREAATATAPSWFPGGDGFLFSTDIGRDSLGVARYSLATRRWEHVVDPGWEAAAFVAADGGRILLAVNEDGETRLRLLDGSLRERASPRLPGAGAAFFTAATPAPLLPPRSEAAVVTFTSSAAPAEVWAVTPEAPPRRLTFSPSAIPEELEVEPERHRVRSFDGLEVPVFLYRPPRPAPGAFPVALFVHGGPEAQFVPAFNPVVLHLLDCGIAVVAPNVRGSTGYGSRFAHLDDGRRRLDAVGDLAAIHGWLPSVGLDPARAALTGGSYGGYMTLAGLAFQPRLWAAGVSIVGISSLVTFLENTSAWRRALREREYGSLERDRDFLLAASPLTHVDSIRAPLLLIHGANDPRVPLGEAEQLHARLSARGVRCELVVYADEGHGLARLRNRLDAYPRMAGFLEEVLLGR